MPCHVLSAVHERWFVAAMMDKCFIRPTEAIILSLVSVHSIGDIQFVSQMFGLSAENGWAAMCLGRKMSFSKTAPAPSFRWFAFHKFWCQSVVWSIFNYSGKSALLRIKCGGNVNWSESLSLCFCKTALTSKWKEIGICVFPFSNGNAIPLRSVHLFNRRTTTL